MPGNRYKDNRRILFIEMQIISLPLKLLPRRPRKLTLCSSSSSDASRLPRRALITLPIASMISFPALAEPTTKQTKQEIVVTEHDARYVFVALNISQIINMYLTNSSDPRFCEDSVLGSLLLAYDEACQSITDGDVKLALMNIHAQMDIGPCSPYPMV